MPYYGPSTGGGQDGAVRVATDFATVTGGSTLSFNTAGLWVSVPESECSVPGEVGDTAIFGANYLVNRVAVEFNGDVAVVDTTGTLIRRVVNTARGAGSLYATQDFFDAKGTAFSFEVLPGDISGGLLTCRLAIRTVGERSIFVDDLAAHFSLTVIGG